MKLPRPRRNSRTAERKIETLIPADAADYLEASPHRALYDTPLVVNGVTVPLNSRIAFMPPAQLDRRTLRR